MKHYWVKFDAGITREIIMHRGYSERVFKELFPDINDSGIKEVYIGTDDEVRRLASIRGMPNTPWDERYVMMEAIYKNMEKIKEEVKDE
jgi:hypothetical protein